MEKKGQNHSCTQRIKHIHTAQIFAFPSSYGCKALSNFLIYMYITIGKQCYQMSRH